MDRKNYTIAVFQKDRRCKKGEKLFGSYCYFDKTEDNMIAEILDLTRQLYPASKFRFELNEIK